MLESEARLAQSTITQKGRMHGRHRIKELRVVGQGERVIAWQQDITHILHQDGVAGAIIRACDDGGDDCCRKPVEESVLPERHGPVVHAGGGGSGHVLGCWYAFEEVARPEIIGFHIVKAAA